MNTQNVLLDRPVMAEKRNDARNDPVNQAHHTLTFRKGLP